MKRFNRRLVLSDEAFKWKDYFATDEEHKLLIKYFQETVFDPKCGMFPDIIPYIIREAKNNNLDPQIIANLLLTFACNLSKNATMADVLNAMGLAPHMILNTKISVHARMLRKLYDNIADNKDGYPVKIMDVENLVVKNKATYALYQVLPFLGAQNLYVYKRTANPDGSIDHVDRVLKHKAPFGVKFFWKNSIRLNMVGLIP